MIHATARVWPVPRVWVEAGTGLAQLGYRADPQTGATITRFWAPGREVAIGVDVLRGPTVSVMALVRYASATFDGLTVKSVSLQIGLLGRQ
jgi:hypothetical protein